MSQNTISVLGELASLVDTSLISYDNQGVLPAHDECQSCLGHPRPAILAPWKVPVKPNRVSPALMTNGEHWVDMYHGTSIESMTRILCDGIDARQCEQPSFGHGIYFTPCPRLAASFAVDGLVLCCKVNMKSVLWFDAYKNPAEHNILGQELSSKTEYIVFQPQNVVCMEIAHVNSTLEIR
jgi:hypothetical protein